MRKPPQKKKNSVVQLNMLDLPGEDEIKLRTLASSQRQALNYIQYRGKISGKTLPSYFNKTST